MNRAPLPSAEGAPSARIVVADALALPVLCRGEPQVLAGEAQLGREIRWVHAGEVPDIAALLNGGELLLTSGMGIGRRPADQRRFVAALAERDVAALVIELGEALPQVPPALVRAAEARGLPLVALRREVAFVEATEAIHRAIVDARYELLRRGERIHRELTQLVVDGQGVSELIAHLAERLAAPVLLHDGDGRQLAAADGPGGAGSAVSAWAKRDEPGRTRVVAPVALGPLASPGRLTALASTRGLDELAAIAIQEAATVIALLLLEERQEQELMARERGSFMGDLVGGHVAGEDARVSALALGLSAEHDRLLPVAVSGDEIATLAEEVQQALQRAQLPSLVAASALPGVLVALVGLAREAERTDAAEAVAAAIRTAIGVAEVRIAVGPAVGWDGAGGELARAAETACVVVDLPPRPWHDARRHDLTRLLWRARGDGELERFVARRLGLLLVEEAGRERLLTALAALCAAGWSKAAAARALGLNRHALYLRVQRIEELLGIDLADPQQQLVLHLALRARPFAVPPAAPVAGRLTA
ncbi:MAG TPA: PucR family transcriptional regulator [Conexibacter sp.]|nr:PucR family transcriptional regulator [Conexibacter sp.]